MYVDMYNWFIHFHCLIVYCVNVTVFLLIHLFLDIQFFDDFLQGALFLSFPMQFFVFSLLIVEYINFVFCGGKLLFNKQILTNIYT